MYIFTSVHDVSSYGKVEIIGLDIDGPGNDGRILEEMEKQENR